MNLDYISANGIAQENELCDLIKEYCSDNSYMLYVYTTKFGCEQSIIIDDVAHLLEVRVFDENCELKAVRSQIGKPFCWRYINDFDFKEKLSTIADEYDGDYDNRTFEEYQYLDVNTRLSKGTDYVSIGGGHYTMPEENLEKVKIINYVCYDENSGVLQITDFRIAGFLRKEEN